MYRKALFAGTLLCASLIATACGGDDDDDATASTVETFTATLTPAAEGTSVASSGTGTVTLKLRSDDTIEYTVDAQNLTSPPMFIRLYGPDATTGVGTPLAPVKFTPIGNTVHTTGVWNFASATVSIDSLATLLRAGQAYINVHTQSYVDGEIRGTIQ